MGAYLCNREKSNAHAHYTLYRHRSEAEDDRVIFEPLQIEIIDTNVSNNNTYYKGICVGARIIAACNN